MTCGLQLNIPIFDRSLLSRSLKRWQGKKRLPIPQVSLHTYVSEYILHYKSQIYSIA